MEVTVFALGAGWDVLERIVFESRVEVGGTVRVLDSQSVGFFGRRKWRWGGKGESGMVLNRCDLHT